MSFSGGPVGGGGGSGGGGDGDGDGELRGANGVYWLEGEDGGDGEVLFELTSGVGSTLNLHANGAAGLVLQASGDGVEGGDVALLVNDSANGRVLLTSDPSGAGLGPDLIGALATQAAPGNHTHAGGYGSLAAPTYLVLQNAGTYTAYDRTGAVVSSSTSLLTVFNVIKGSNRWIQLGPGIFDFGADHASFNTLDNQRISGSGMGITHVKNSTDDAADTEPLSYTNCQQQMVTDMDISAGGAVRTSSDALDFDGGDNHLIERVRVLDSRGRGIVFDGKDLGRTGDNNTVRDCVITGCRGGTSQAGTGVLFLGAPHGLVTGCRIYGNTGYGVSAQKAASGAAQPNKTSSGLRVLGNVIYENGISGVNLNSASNCIVANNEIYNNSDDLAGRDGVEITISDAIVPDRNIIANNRIYDDAGGSATQDYGVMIPATATNTVVTGNSFSGHVSGPVSDSGTGTTGYTTPATITAVIDGAGSVIVAGVKIFLRVPWAATITGWEIISDVAGSIVVDVDRATYAGFPSYSSIAGSEKPTLSSAQKNTDTALSTWTTTLDAGDWLRLEVEATPATVTIVAVALIMQRLV